VLESAYAAGFSMHGHFRSLAGMGDGVKVEIKKKCSK